jgi:hypothetical protein
MRLFGGARAIAKSNFGGFLAGKLPKFLETSAGKDFDSRTASEETRMIKFIFSSVFLSIRESFLPARAA